MKCKRVVDCLKNSWPAGANAKNFIYNSRRKTPNSYSVNLTNKADNAFSCSAGLPSMLLIVRSTFSQSQDHATSCWEPQSLHKDRKDANITDLYSDKLTVPVSLDIRRASTSHSSCKRPTLATLATMVGKEANTSFIQVRLPKPMTAALNKNMSSNVFGTAVFMESLVSSTAPSLPPEFPAEVALEASQPPFFFFFLLFNISSS